MIISIVLFFLVGLFVVIPIAPVVTVTLPNRFSFTC